MAVPECSLGDLSSSALGLFIPSKWMVLKFRTAINPLSNGQNTRGPY